MKLEKIYTIASLLVIGAGIFAHSITLQNSLSSLSKNHDKTTLNVSNIEKNITNIQSKYGSLDSKIGSNEKELILLRKEIEKTGNILRESTAETKKILIEYLSKK